MNTPGKKQADFGFGVRPQKYADDIPVPEYRESGTRQNEIDDMVGFVKGVRDSSLDAYAEIKESGRLGKQESVIYRFLLNLQNVYHHATKAISDSNGPRYFRNPIWV